MAIPGGHGHFTLVGEGIRLVPSMSDQYYPLLKDIVVASGRLPQSFGLPATATILAVATVESYVNELIGMAPFGASPAEKDSLKRQLRQLDTDVVAKLRRLAALAPDPEGVSDETVDDFALLFGIRGLLVHFDPQEEHPRFTRTSAQRLCRRMGIEIPQDNRDWASLPFLLTPALCEWSLRLTERCLKELFKAGYHPPRPRWYPVVRSDAT